MAGDLSVVVIVCPTESCVWSRKLRLRGGGWMREDGLGMGWVSESIQIQQVYGLSVETYRLGMSEGGRGEK